MFFDMARAGKPVKSERNAFRSTGNRHLHLARHNIIKLMKPVLDRCKRDGLVLVNRYLPSQRWTPTQLVAEWKMGRYIRGPVCWRLEKAEAS